MPPIKCIPCRVTYEGQRFQIASDGTVRYVYFTNNDPLSKFETAVQTLEHEPVSDDIARLVRREASRLRHNRNARERNQARRDLGLVKTPYGWE